MGGDGPKPRYVLRKKRKSSSKVHLDPIIFHKREDLIDSGLLYARDLKRLFENFGVRITKISVKDGYERRDKTRTKKIVMKISNSRESIGNLTQKIGYRYCINKQELSSYIAEYLRIRENRITERIKLKKSVTSLYKRELSRSGIASRLGLNPIMVSRIRENYNNRIYAPKLIPPIHVWVSKATNNIGKCALWEEIISVKPAVSKDVRDFTTSEDTHSFIANGFITHNCPAETPEGSSIGLRKHLALMAEITPGLSEREETDVMNFIKGKILK